MLNPEGYQRFFYCPVMALAFELLNSPPGNARLVLGDFFNVEILEALLAENSPIEMSIRSGIDAPREVSVPYDRYRWQTAGHATRFSTASNPNSSTVGYFQVRMFLLQTHDEIYTAFQDLQDQGNLEELIVNLRYNPGDRTWVVRHWHQ